MRNWCVAIAFSALLALPLCAQQNGDGASAPQRRQRRVPPKQVRETLRLLREIFSRFPRLHARNLFRPMPNRVATRPQVNFCRVTKSRACLIT